MRETESTMRDDKQTRLFLTQTDQNLCILILWPSQASAKPSNALFSKHSLELFHSAHHPDTLSNMDRSSITGERDAAMQPSFGS